MRGELQWGAGGTVTHDQLFKELLHEFFREFMELFVPDVSAQLDFSQVTFLDRELFTDPPEGLVREPDIVARVATRDGGERLVLIHIELQSERRSEFRYRMFEYYALLRLRFKLPVFPIVLYLVPGTGGVTRETYRETLFTYELLTFQWAAIGLPDLNASDYGTSAGTLAAALAALMRPLPEGKIQQKISTVQFIAGEEDNEARKVILLNLVEKYLKLTPEEEAEYLRLLSQPEFKEATDVISVYEERGIEKGLEQGREQGREQGLEQGRQEATQLLSVYEERGIEKGLEQGREQGALVGQREALLRLLTRRFGPLSTQVQAQVEAITDRARLESMFDQAIDVQSLQTLGLTGEPQSETGA